jgi:hypothetical protein
MRPDIFLGSELAEIRVHDGLRAADRHRFLAAADEGRPPRRLSIRRPGFPRPPIRRPSVRRPLALLLAALSRRTAGLVRVLDDCVFEDLGRSLASHD